MASGRLWQIVLWRGARPGILLQMMLAPSATTDDRPLRWMRDVLNGSSAGVLITLEKTQRSASSQKCSLRIFSNLTVEDPKTWKSMIATFSFSHPAGHPEKLTRFSDRPLQGRGKNGRSSAVSSCSWCSARPMYQCISLVPLPTPRGVSRCSGLRAGIELLETNQSLWKCARPDFIWYVSGGVVEHLGSAALSSGEQLHSSVISLSVCVCVYLLYQGVFCRGSHTHTLSLQVHAQLIYPSVWNKADLRAAETRSRVRPAADPGTPVLASRLTEDQQPARFFIELPRRNAPPTDLTTFVQVSLYSSYVLNYCYMLFFFFAVYIVNMHLWFCSKNLHKFLQECWGSSHFTPDIFIWWKYDTLVQREKTHGVIKQFCFILYILSRLQCLITFVTHWQVLTAMKNVRNQADIKCSRSFVYRRTLKW